MQHMEIQKCMENVETIYSFPRVTTCREPIGPAQKQRHSRTYQVLTRRPQQFVCLLEAMMVVKGKSGNKNVK